MWFTYNPIPHVFIQAKTTYWWICWASELAYILDCWQVVSPLLLKGELKGAVLPELWQFDLKMPSFFHAINSKGVKPAYLLGWVGISGVDQLLGCIVVYIQNNFKSHTSYKCWDINPTCRLSAFRWLSKTHVKNEKLPRFITRNIPGYIKIIITPFLQSRIECRIKALFWTYTHTQFLKFKNFLKIKTKPCTHFSLMLL